MPIYEFTCGDCGAEFELIVQSSTKLECPSCASRTLIKQFSSFAVGANSAPACSPAPAMGGG